MQTRITELKDPMGATRIEISEFKCGKTLRRERRERNRKNGR